MRLLAIVVMLATGCMAIPNALIDRAQTQLGVSKRHLFMDRDSMGDRYVYTFCRVTGKHDIGSPLPWISTPTYNAACVMYFCPQDRSTATCTESMM